MAYTPEHRQIQVAIAARIVFGKTATEHRYSALIGRNIREKPLWAIIHGRFNIAIWTRFFPLARANIELRATADLLAHNARWQIQAVAVVLGTVVDYRTVA